MTLRSVSEVENDTDCVDKPPNSYHVTFFDIGAIIYAIIFHFVDVGFDIFLAYSYFIAEQYSYFAWTVAFTAIPSVVITSISLRMYFDDAQENLLSRNFWIRPALCVAGLGLQLAPIIRYIDSIRYARKCLKAEVEGNKKLQESYFKQMIKEDCDVALLKVFECYIESAFQLVLQVTLVVIEYSYGSELHLIKQSITITLGFLAIGWAMATYHRYIRFDHEEKQNISALGTSVQLIWHFNLTVSRILALSAGAILNPLWTCVAVIVHWCVMTIWVALTRKINFCQKNLILEVLFSGCVGAIYLFNFINLKEGSTKKTYCVLFIAFFIENLTASIVWGIWSPKTITNWVYYLFLILPVTSLLISAFFLIVYYSALHPSKSDKGKNKRENSLNGRCIIKNDTQEQNSNLI